MNKQLFAQTAPPPPRGRGQGVRSRAPPVADAARRSTRSGRKNRAGEQRDDFFGHRKAVGANAAAGYLWSASVRSTDLDFSPQKNLNPYPAQLSVKGVCQGGSSVPRGPVLLPFAGAKGRPPRRAVLIKPCKRLCPAEGEMKLYYNYCRQPLSHGCAVPAPLTQGSL